MYNNKKLIRNRKRIEQYIGKEVFVVLELAEGQLPEETLLDGFKGTITFHSDMDSVNTFIAFFRPEEDNIYVYHGVLTHASFLPAVVDEKQYVILMDNETIDESKLVEVISNEEVSFLADEIENLIDADPFSDYEIEDVYVLYGYNVNLLYGIDIDTLDEEKIDTCLGIIYNQENLDATDNKAFEKEEATVIGFETEPDDEEEKREESKKENIY